MYKFILLLRFININSYRNFKSRCTNGQYDDEAREGNGKLLCPNEAFTEISAGYKADISRYQLCKFRRYVCPASNLENMVTDLFSSHGSFRNSSVPEKLSLRDNSLKKILTF